MEIISKNEKETFLLAKKVADKLLPGEIIALFGDLGSGKTTFTKGLAKALGIKKEITSPTFVIMKQYPLPSDSKKIKNLVHLDCYRMATREDAESIGIYEYLELKDNVTVIEWPENIDKLLANFQFKKINFKYVDETTRKITT